MTSRSPARPRLTAAVGDKDHRLGSDDAPVTLVEYGDFECPYCRQADPVVKEVRRQAGGRLRFVFRHFPLSQAHPHAQHAAEAAEAAGAQDRFWEMHDVLFERQSALDDSDLVAYAEALGLDRARVARELTEGTHEERVRLDFTSGVRSGVNGTPTFFINGYRHDEAWDAEALLAAIGQAR